MNFEAIETAFELLLENVQTIENDLGTHAYDALIEQNSYYLGAEVANEVIIKNNEKLRALNLSKEEWRRAFQFLFIKLGQLEALQANHQFTPDAIGFIILYLLEGLTKDDQLDVLEIGSGTGNLAETLLNNSQKTLNYMGMEVDDLLIDLSASIADVVNSSAVYIQEDAVRPHILKESDVIISAPTCCTTLMMRLRVVSRLQQLVNTPMPITLLMEQSLKYLKKDGIAILLAPTNLLTSPQSDLLKKWLSGYADIIAVITLPEAAFGNKHNMKSIFVLKKQTENAPETFVYPLSDLQNPEILKDFTENFQKWKSDNSIF